jgi:hypothetical protein
MHKSNRFSARLHKSMGRRRLLQKQGLVDPQGNPISSTPKPPEPRVKNITHKPTPQPKPTSFGDKVGGAASKVGEAVFDTAPRAAVNTITGQGKRQKKFEGGVLGALGSAAQTAGKEFRGLVRAKAGTTPYEGEAARDPGGDLDTGPEAGAQQEFHSQTNRKQSQQTKRNQAASKRYLSTPQGQQSQDRRSPANVQNKPVAIQNSFNPALASLLAVSAGFAASDAVVNASGARGARSITDDQLNLFNVMANKKRGRKLRKEHSPLPPIQGLVWDEGAKRWRKPENVGKTASEVQGKKRIRGSALGQTARSPGGTSAGKGRGRGYSRGRAERIATGDIGVAGIAGPKKSSKKRRRRR